MESLRNLSSLHLESADSSILWLLTLPTRMFFPNLRQLEIDCCTTLASTLVDMLGSRIYQLKEAKIYLEMGSKVDVKDIPYELRHQGLKIELYDHEDVSIWTQKRKPLQCGYCGVYFVPRRIFTGVFDNS